MELFDSLCERFAGGYSEPRVKDYLILNARWWHIASALIVYNIFAAKIGPSMMKNSKSFDLRPWLLVYSGLQFGVYGIAMPILSVLTNFTLSAWQCQRPDNHVLIEETFIRLAYTYMWLKVVDVGTTVFMVLRKKPEQDPLLHALRNSALFLIAFLGVKLYPTGFFILGPISDSLVCTLRSSYYVLAAPGPAFRHLLGFKRYIRWTAFITAMINVLHITKQITSGCDGPPGLMHIILLYSLIEGILVFRSIYSSTISNPSKSK